MRIALFIQHDPRRLSTALLLSFLAHALLLSVAVGGQAFGLSGFALPWKERRLAANDLQVLLAMAQPGAPAPATAPATAPASPPANPSAAKKSGPRVLAAMDEPAVANGATAMRAIAAPVEPIARPPQREDAAIAGQMAKDEGERMNAERLALARQEDLRREALRQEQAREEQAREEQKRADAARRDFDRKELIRQEQARQAQLEAAQLEAMRQAQLEAARQARLRQEAARTEQAARDEAARIESERRELARQEDLRREALRQERARQEEQARRDAARREQERADEAARSEAIRQEQARQVQVEAARQAQSRLEAARQEAARQETARQEAARQEREKQERAQRERAEQEAQREERLRAIGRQLAAEAAQRDAIANRPAGSLPPTGTNLRRGWLFGRADSNAQLVQYAEAISRKIERNMTFDMVREVVKQPHVRPIVTMAIRSDGSVEKLTFVVSSGVAAIDEAIRKVVASQASYEAFPPALLSQYDVIEIRRTWIFDVAIRLE